jgi:hypothetical protein
MGDGVGEVGDIGDLRSAWLDDWPEVKVCCRPLAVDPIGALLSLPRVASRGKVPGTMAGGRTRAGSIFPAGGQHLRSVQATGSKP